MSAPKRTPRERLLDRLAGRAPKSGRGLFGAEFRDAYGARVRVSDSSAGISPSMWVWVDGGQIVESGGKNDGSIHLTQEQARGLGDVLLKFARDGHLRPARSATPKAVGPKRGRR